MRSKGLIVGGLLAVLASGCATISEPPASRVEVVRPREASPSPAPARVKKMNPRLKRFLQANVKEIDFGKGLGENAYFCRLTFTSEIAAENQDFARDYFRNRLIEAYMNEHGTTARYVGVSIHSDRAVGAVYTAEARAFEIAETTLAYNPQTRRGVLGLRIREDNLEATRELLRANIEAIARDKNICLTTGEFPPAGRFYLLKEEVIQGNLLQIEFEVE